MSGERIWLIAGEDGLDWCDDPAPTDHHRREDAIEYVRADIHDAEVERLRAIVGRLAVTKDGKRVIPWVDDVHVLLRDRHEIVATERIEQDEWGCWIAIVGRGDAERCVGVHETYSTPAAAIADAERVAGEVQP